MRGYPCSSPGCQNAATWAVLSETPREGDASEWGIWNYAGTLACEGHRDVYSHVLPSMGDRVAEAMQDAFGDNSR